MTATIPIDEIDAAALRNLVIFFSNHVRAANSVEGRALASEVRVLTDIAGRAESATLPLARFLRNRETPHDPLRYLRQLWKRQRCFDPVGL